MLFSFCPGEYSSQLLVWFFQYPGVQPSFPMLSAPACGAVIASAPTRRVPATNELRIFEPLRKTLLLSEMGPATGPTRLVPHACQILSTD